MWYIALLVFVFSGCSVYYDALQSDGQMERYVSATRKAEIVNKLHTEAVILATDLHSVFPGRYSKDETVFLVDMFVADDSSEPEKRGLFNAMYRLSLNEQSPVVIERLGRDELIERHFPYTSPWGEYFFVVFKQRYQRSMDLEIERVGLKPMMLEFRPSSTEALLERF